MAPCSYSTDYISLKMSEKERHKLRKPVVEKMRRDRINSSIEQLKALLETEFRKSDPSAKLEKADVLEMTVSFLKQQLQPRAAANQMGYSHGYSQCWGEALRYLSFSSKGNVSVKQRYGSHGTQVSTKKLCPESPASSKQSPVTAGQSAGAGLPLWRPW
ncbi:transcription factor HES-5-like [Anguilla anguilla]|uniref:transcription factor HES-5-like n=1 Tax=Anguilla anguilla TaxID=7936 RepID=UPI0015AC1937|nr:transcription factor HES-5-like [Anguilla anguilla]